MLTFTLCLRQTPSTQDLYMSCSGTYYNFAASLSIYVCSFRAWNKVSFPFSHKILLSPFRKPVTNCHYIFNCRFTSFFLSFKNVWSICSMPGSRHSELWRIYGWLRARSLFSWSLVSGGKGRQESIQSNSNNPRRKMLVAVIPGQNSTPNRVLWHKALP